MSQTVFVTEARMGQLSLWRTWSRYHPDTPAATIYDDCRLNQFEGKWELWRPDDILLSLNISLDGRVNRLKSEIWDCIAAQQVCPLFTYKRLLIAKQSVAAPVSQRVTSIQVLANGQIART